MCLTTEFLTCNIFLMISLKSTCLLFCSETKLRNRSFDISFLLMMNNVQIVRSEIKDIQELHRLFQTKVKSDKVNNSYS